jgi:hypothetical protein
MSFNSVSVEMGKEQAQALSTILRAIDSGNYHPVGCVELYWAVHSLSLRSHVRNRSFVSSPHRKMMICRDRLGTKQTGNSKQ